MKCSLGPVIAVFLIGLLLTSCQRDLTRENPRAEDPSRAAGWIEKAPEEVGLDATPLANLRRRLHDTPSENVHSVLIVKGEALVFEEYMSGRDQNWGDDLESIRFERDTLHDLRSSTKSIVGVLVSRSMMERSQAWMPRWWTCFQRGRSPTQVANVRYSFATCSL